MGGFTDRIKRAFQSQPSLAEELGLEKNAVIRPMKKGESSGLYLIRDSEDKSLFIHYRKDNGGEYFAAEGPKMACCWKWKEAHAFVQAAKQQSGIDTLEMIRLDEVQKDPSYDLKM